MQETHTQRPRLGLRARHARLERRQLRIGFIPLSDCVPLAVAKEHGLFAAQGLEVELVREPSWANIRDKVMLGALDGAQMLAAMPIAATLGLRGVRKPMLTAFSLGLNGNAITVSRALHRRLAERDPDALAVRPVTAAALRGVIEADRRAGRPPMTFAVVYPFSSHAYELRYWMAAAGIDPRRDVRIVVIPPPQMVARLRAGEIDGYCVGEPWNTRAVKGGLGHVLVTSHQIWNHKPEKVLGVTEEWAERHPNTHRALLMALLEAARWLDGSMAHREQAAELLVRGGYVNAPLEDVRLALTDRVQYGPESSPQSHPDFNVFHRFAANFPWRSHAVWFLTQMYRWGQIDRAVDIGLAAARSYRPDIYREAARSSGVAAPVIDAKPEGLNADAWTLAQARPAALAMGSDAFLDGGYFDPARPARLSAATRHGDLRGVS